MEEMPGTLVRERSDLAASIQNSLTSDPAGTDPRYLAAKDQFCPWEDGNSAKRVVRFFLEDDPDELADEPAEEKAHSPVPPFSSA